MWSTPTQNQKICFGESTGINLKKDKSREPPAAAAGILHSPVQSTHTSPTHAAHRPLLYFPPPPNYPPPRSFDPEMSDDPLLGIPGPSTQEPTWNGPNDYSYAYYEPGPPTRHTNVPNRYPGGGSGSARSSYREGTYRTKHTYLTRYGTEENIYEEITDMARARMRPHHHHQQSMVSINQSLLEEEVRRVQTGHKRVLGELNLSVEAMLMPSNSREGSDDTDREAEVDDQLADLLTVGPTDELLSPVPMVDLDSGFSGSSSGASYRSAAGSLRRGPEKMKSSGAATKTSTPAEATSSSKGFWGRKAWKKLGLSNISLNKNKGELAELCLDLKVSRKVVVVTFGFERLPKV